MNKMNPISKNPPLNNFSLSWNDRGAPQGCQGIRTGGKRTGGAGVIWNELPFETLVIPAKAGIQSVGGAFPTACGVDSRFRGNDCTWERPCLANDTSTAQARVGVSKRVYRAMQPCLPCPPKSLRSLHRTLGPHSASHPSGWGFARLLGLAAPCYT